jgi:hypothetical protein
MLLYKAPGMALLQENFPCSVAEIRTVPGVLDSVSRYRSHENWKPLDEK